MGSDADVLALRSDSTRVVDLQGRFVMPGIIDAHVHLYGEALTRRATALADIKQALVETIRQYNQWGITSIHEPGSGDLTSSGITHRELYEQLRREGRLTLRISMMRYPPLPAGAKPEGDDWIRVSGVKLRLDFDMAARRALLLEPYDDDPKTRGVQHLTFDQLVEHITAAHESGFQISVHAIGDRANRLALDGFEKAGVPPQARPRIEHAQLVHSEDVPRFKKLGVLASMQPVHCIHDLRWIRQRIGDRRSKGAYAWKTLRRETRVAFGSDSPVESADPFLGMYAALTRQNERGEPAVGWQAEERLSIEEIIRAYTIDAAFAEFQEAQKGSLEPGKLADFVVLSHDLRRILPLQLLETQVLITVVGGRLVYVR